MPVDVSDGFGFTALHCATLLNQSNIINRLMYEGPDVNRQTHYYDDTPLHRAARHNNTEVVRLLLDNGADINLKNDDNEIPLDVADKGSKVESLLLQLQQSAS